MLLSTCCNAKIKYSDPAPDFLGDTHPLIGTCCCLCSKCGEACNVYEKTRKTWKINPATKIKQNEKKIKKVKLTKKEIDELRRNEDF